MKRKRIWLFCAWVLWSESLTPGLVGGTSPRFLYLIRETYETKSACESARAKITAQESGDKLGRYLCVPDTINLKPGN
jgi:hypothetical protein